MKPENADKKFRTFPSKSNFGRPPPMPQMTDGNKFQQMATFHKQQEKSGDFYANRKIHFSGTPRMQYREGGKFYKPPRDETEKSGKFGNKKVGKKFEKKGAPEEKTDVKKGKKTKKVKKMKGDPVKGTSTEYDQLTNSDEDDDDVADVSDMIAKDSDEEDEKDAEIPLINTARKSTTKSVASKRFTALGDYEDVDEPEDEDEDDAPPPKKQKKSNGDSDDSDDEDAPEEVEEDEEEEDDEDERLKFREEISQMPLGKVREMKEKLGIKLFNKTYFGTSEVDKKRQEEKKKLKSEAVNGEKSGGQHRPKEMSSKRPVSTFRNIYGDHEKGTKKKRWDPRFDARAGDFKEVCFENNYQFLDDIRSGEMQDLRNEYSTARAEGDEKKAARLKNTIQKMETSEKTRAEKRRQAETRKELHDDNIDRMLRGEAPIFRTKAQVRRIDAEKKYEELKKDNKLDKYLQRKAKKESAKQKKARPFEGYGFQN
ncbi:hypothetical protein CRE_09238 [Caenorhabditis remanei]|uniref:rRNA biogenesis protein RRP36 n=1 Tax=Caenorhabditis remanei TaxID=31234 RepID=E3LHP1_CAERE|nr:hypothetical protein CRE_09238 [Caenorhabditis remanei]